jgi:hypothetical protein
MFYSSDPSQHLLQRRSRQWKSCYTAYEQFKAIQAGDWLVSPDHPEADVTSVEDTRAIGRVELYSKHEESQDGTPPAHTEIHVDDQGR